MWPQIILFGVLFLRWVYGRIQAADAPAAAKPPTDAFQLPKSEESAPIPLFYGRVRIRGPIVIYARNFDASERRESVNGDDVVVGYDYRLMIQFLLGTPGHRDTSADTPTALTRAWVGERLVWSGSLSKTTELRYVNKPSLLGGPNAGGGVEGFISYLPGSFTQTNNLVVKAALVAGEANEDVAYRGQAVVTLLGVGVPGDGNNLGGNGGDGAVYDADSFSANLSSGALAPRGWKFGESPQLDGYSFEVEARTTSTALGGTLGLIGQDANPVAVLYDLLTNQWNRIGLATGKIDTASFLAAGQTLATEGNGFSIVISNEMSARDAIGLILAQIDGVLFEDSSTGTLKLKLVRADYTVGLLDVIDPSSSIEVISWAAGTWNETFNQVRVVFSDRINNYADSVAIAQNQANIYAASGRVRSRENRYPGCCTRQLAETIVARDLRAVSLPLAKLRIAVNRSAYAMQPGDVFRFTWSDWNITDAVFRVARRDLGKLGDERVILDCLQDRFAFDGKVFRIPRPPTRIPSPLPFPSTERTTEEAPRWPTQRGSESNRVGDHELPRTHHIPIPRAGGIATTYHAEVTVDATGIARDIEPQPFPAYGQVETAYARELEPYDTTTGLRITGVVGITPSTATTDDIKNLGKNVIKVGREYMAFEGVTLISGTAGTAAAIYKLTNVWRALFDTAAIAHPVGERVTFHADERGFITSRIGRVGWQVGAAPVVRQVVHGANTRVAPFFRLDSGFPATAKPAAMQVPHAIEDDVINHDHPQAVFNGSIGARVSLAYPPVDVLVNGSKTPARLEEDGVDISWTRRSRLSDVIVRGDAADEEPEASTLYKPIAKAATNAVQAQYGDYAGVGEPHAVHLDYTATSVDNLVLGLAGFGDLLVGVESDTPVYAQGSRVVFQPSWEIPTVTIECPEWRNLVRNGRFATGTIKDGTIVGVQDGDGWMSLSGVPLIGSGASGLGGAGSYAYASTAVATTIAQSFNVVGFEATGLNLEFHFYDKNITGAGSATVTGTVTVSDFDGNAIATATTGSLTPSSTQWTHRVVTLDDLRDAFTPLNPNIGTRPFSVRLDLDLGSHGGTAVTEVIVRVGQTALVSGSHQLLANPDFEAGTFTSWTNGSNSFVADTTAPLYVATRYARPGNFASSEIYQSVNVPAGYAELTYAVLELGRANLNSDHDTGEVILEARNGSGSVLDSVTTGAEFITPAGAWVRRRLVLDIPDGTVTLRLRLVGVRATGTTCDTAFDDLDLRLHKRLAPVSAVTYGFDVPISQPMPADLDYWDRAWPTVTPPNLALWYGAEQGGLGIEPELAVDVDLLATKPATFGGKFVGAYDATANGAISTTAFEFPAGCDGPLTANHAEFAAFRSIDAFTVLVFVRLAEELAGAAFSICGRFNGAAGWHLTVDASGHAVATLKGDGGTKTATGTRFVVDRAVHMFALVYDPTAAELRLIDEDGEVVTSTASGLGEMDDDDPTTSFMMGLVSGVAPLVDSQIARVFAWNTAIATADLQLTMTQGGTPNVHLSQTRTAGTFAAVVGADDGGLLVTRFDPSQYAVGYSSQLVVEGSVIPRVTAETGYGLVLLLPQTNAVNVASQAQATGDWHTVGATVVVGSSAGVEGIANAVSITGTNAQRHELRGITAGAAVDKQVAFFARGPSAHNARFELANASDVVKGTWDFAVATEWQLCWHHFSTWDNSTPTCRLRWCGSDGAGSQAIEICGPFLLNEGTEMPGAIPVGSGTIGHTAVVLTVAPPADFNYEGEIEIQGASTFDTPLDDSLIAQVVGSGGGNNDLRVVSIDNTGELTMLHYDGAGVSNTAATAPQSDWSAGWTARGRWNAAALVDQAGKFTSVVYGNTLDEPIGYGRTATWTPSSTPVTQVFLGIGDFGDSMNGLIRRVIVRAREERLS